MSSIPPGSSNARKAGSAGVSANAHYRPDIDGLRAVAVLSVLLFHAFPLRLPGGFAGVDIFFVISGFLISGLILSGLERDRFSFVDFYNRRIRRIFPALLLVCGACLACGWLCLMPAEFRQLGKHVFAGAAFSSNFVLLAESGYFDVDGVIKPLRHLWSLGIEEQYYLVWPVLLFLCRKGKRSTELLLITLGLASFGFSLYMTWADRALAYYLPFTRFWELMIGSGLAYLERHRPVAGLANARANIGAIGIALGLVLINARQPFPGWWALLVCAGAALVISAGAGAWFNRRILASRPMVWVGLISYPLYLWHWPLISFANIISYHPPSIITRLAALLASVVLAWSTYRFLELPVRQSKDRPRLRRTTWGLAASMVLLAMIGGLVGNRVLQSASVSDPRVSNISEARADWESIDNETVPGSVPNTVLFFGDSHMEQYWPRAELIAQRAGPRRTVEFRTTGGCAPIPALERVGSRCAEFVRQGFARAAESNVDTVVLAAQWKGLETYKDYYRPNHRASAPLDVLAPENAWVFEEFEAALAHLRHERKRVVVLLSSPSGEAFDPRSMVDRRGFIPVARTVLPVSRAKLVGDFFAVDSRIRAAAERADAEVMDPMDWFCDGPICPVQNSIGRPVSRDGSHICASVVRSKATGLDQLIELRPPAGAGGVAAPVTR
ncbi:MAG: acyltransferase [Pseudomonadota bacterium]|nr:acyltransferase [Pseudomonadota bacterium]